MLSRYLKDDGGSRRTGFVVAGVTLLLATSFIQAAAYAARGTVEREPLTMAEAVTLAEKASTPDFPVLVNDKVLARLNGIITDPGKARYHRESLDRMKRYAETITTKIEDYGHPLQLLAVPLIESGYRNLPPREHKLRRGVIESAGLWQFIRPTALSYGLRVEDQVDERLDVGLETDAAMRYLRDALKEFDHWHLSLAAYNQGSSFVRNAIVKGKSRDPFKLIEGGYLGDYLVKLMAAIIILDNPDLVE